LLSKIGFKLRTAKRVGAFSREVQTGMTPVEARAYSDALYPQSAADKAYEDRLRQELNARESETRTTRPTKQSRKSLLSFIVDLALTSVPTIDAAILHHGGWATYVVFFTTMAALRYISNLAAKRSWTMLHLIIWKASILIVTEIAVSVSAMEVCNETVTTCHRIFF
jgi:hypothetical protein